MEGFASALGATCGNDSYAAARIGALMIERGDPRRAEARALLEVRSSLVVVVVVVGGGGGV